MYIETMLAKENENRITDARNIMFTMVEGLDYYPENVSDVISEVLSYAISQARTEAYKDTKKFIQSMNN